MSAVSLRLEAVLSRLSIASPFSREQSSTPARIMAPRIVYATVALVLVLFGLTMIFSSSSITGLTSSAYDRNPAYFLVRQFAYALIGLVGCALLAHVDYHVWRDRAITYLWVATLIALVLTYTPLAGHDANGATRWLGIGSATVQPAEFAKVEVVLMGARIAQAYFEDGSIDAATAAKLMAGGVGLPLLLILMQPDKGTCGVLLMTLIVMLYLSGFSGLLIVGIGVVALVVGLTFAYFDAYSRARILTVLDPWSDPHNTGYQSIQGFYALGTGGLFGRGLGMSRQKYNYLPMAYNDYIFAIIGEELGFVGCVAMIVCFGVLLWAGLKIAENAPDLAGRLIAAGSTSLMIIQLLLNLAGVTGMFPLSGKPVPFVSYGGSSVISSLLLVGTTLSVSMCSKLPETLYERRRASLRLAKDDGEGSGVRPQRRTAPAPAAAAAVALDEHGVSDARPRSARLVRTGAQSTSYAHLRVLDGGAGRTDDDASRSRTTAGYGVGAAALGQTRTPTRSNVSAGYERRDLGPTPAERLRETRGRTKRLNTER